MFDTGVCPQVGEQEQGAGTGNDERCTPRGTTF